MQGFGGMEGLVGSFTRGLAAGGRGGAGGMKGLVAQGAGLGGLVLGLQVGGGVQVVVGGGVQVVEVGGVTGLWVEGRGGV